MDTCAIWVGYVVMVAGGFVIVCGVIIGASLSINYAIRKALDCYGGWKVFIEYREWYWQHEKTAAAPQTKEKS